MDSALHRGGLRSNLEKDEKGRPLKRPPDKDFYEILKVSPSASRQEITKAYRELVSRYHPDKHQDNELKDLAEHKLAELNEAYEILSNPTSRAAYDAKRRQPGFSTGAPPQSYGRVTMTPFPYAKLLVVLAFIAGAFFAFRFVRNPRMGAILGVIIAAVWFGPRIVRYFRTKGK